MKAISTVLTIAAVAALVVTTAGVGVAVAGGFTIGAGISGVAGAIGISSSLLVGLSLAGLTYLAGGSPGAPKPEQTETAIKSPTPPRVSGYGRQRLHTTYSLYVTASDGSAVDVGAFHDGRVDAIEQHYLADKKITVLPNGFVQRGPDNEYGEFSDIVQVGTTLGPATNIAFAKVIAAVPDHWTTDHRGDGVVTGYVISKPVKAEGFQMVYPNGGPNASPLSLTMRLQPVFDWRDPAQSVSDPLTWKWSENALLHLAHYLLVRDNKDWATHFAPTLDYWTAAANDCDSPMPLRGVQAVLAADVTAGSSSITVTTANGLAAGIQVAISATGNTDLSETRTVSGITDNGGSFTLALSSPVANNHPAGSSVTWEGNGASEARYRGCVVHKHTDAHKDVISNLLSCFDGWMAPRADGALVVYSGRYYPPTESLGPDEIISYSLQDGVDEENAVNQIAVTYISANHDFNAVDTDAWEDADDIARRGKTLSDTLEIQSPSFSQNRRLAKRKMARAMARRRGQLTTNAAGRRIRGHRYIHIDLTDAGTTFFAGAVEVIKLTRNLTTGGVTIEWVEADPNVDAWNPATEEGTPAPVGNSVAASPLSPPVIVSATPDFTAVSDDGTGVRVVIVASGLDRDDVTWFARWRVLGAVTWNEARYSDIDSSASVTIQTGFVPTGATVEVQVAYQTGDGRVSPYSVAQSVVTRTDATPPDAAANVAVISWSDTLTLATDRVARASSYRWRVFAQYTYQPALYQAGPAASYTFDAGNATRVASSDGWTGNFYGSSGIVGECLFIFRMVTGGIFVGLSDGREYVGGPSDYTFLDFSIQKNDTQWRIWEGGSVQAEFTSINGIPNRNNQVFAIGYKGTTVTYYILTNEGTFASFRTVETTTARKFYPGGAGVTNGAKVDQMQFRADGSDLRLTIPAVLVRTIVTTTRQVSYTQAQAAADGIRRAYTIDVAGVNAAGAGTVATSALLTNPPPPTVTGVATPDDATTAAVSFDLLSGVPDLAGYIVAYSSKSGFDPLTEGFLATNNGASPHYIYGLSAGTYYVRVAAFDTWTDNPRLLNFSNEDSFVITAGGGSSGGGTGTGGSGGGYCPTTDTLILLANTDGTGPGTQKMAGDLNVGDRVWTQHEVTMEWGAYPVAAISIKAEPVLKADIGITRMRATAGHRVWLGGGWMRFDTLGTFDGVAPVAQITITDAHTYVSNGVLSHNAKANLQ